MRLDPMAIPPDPPSASASDDLNVRREWRTVLSDSACLACVAMDRHPFPPEVPALAPHPRCGSTIVTVAESSSISEREHALVQFAHRPIEWQIQKLGNEGFWAYRRGDVILPEFIGYGPHPGGGAMLRRRTLREATGKGQSLEDRVDQLMGDLRYLPRGCPLYITRFPTGVVDRWRSSVSDRIIILSSRRTHYLNQRRGTYHDLDRFERAILRSLLYPEIITRETGAKGDAVVYAATFGGLWVRVPILIIEREGDANVIRTAYPNTSAEVRRRIRSETVIWKRGG